MIKTFDHAVKFLEKYAPDPDKKFPGNLGLLRMGELCHLLGNPQLKYSTIHVGGTSGKGSTATIIASILATKHKVGLHTSPHLVRINERIKISSNNKKQITKNKNRFKDISDQNFICLINEIRPVVEKMEKGRWDAPSYFEIVTAMAFLYFKQQKVEIAVIEVGLGGRFDATNVVKPLVAVLTNVGLDHMDVLGNTVEKIAEDKVGIIKSGVQVVSGVKQPAVVEIVKRKALSVNPPAGEAGRKDEKNNLSLIGRDFTYKVKSIMEMGSVFDYKGNPSGSGLQGAKGLTLNNLKLNLLGEFQVENAALAMKVMEDLSDFGFRISDFNLRIGLKEAFIPGRLEVINNDPLIILDGAHNPDKMTALVRSIKTIFPGKKVTALIAIKEDKNAKKILQLLVPICKEVVFTRYEIKADQGIIRSYDPYKLRQLAITLRPQLLLSVEDKPLKVIKLFKEKAGRDDLLLVTGSLYLLGIVM